VAGYVVVRTAEGIYVCAESSVSCRRGCRRDIEVPVDKESKVRKNQRSFICNNSRNDKTSAPRD